MLPTPFSSDSSDDAAPRDDAVILTYCCLELNDESPGCLTVCTVAMRGTSLRHLGVDREIPHPRRVVGSYDLACGVIRRADDKVSIVGQVGSTEDELVLCA